MYNVVLFILVLFTPEEYRFIETARGGRLLILEGLAFRRRNKTVKGRSYWFCCMEKCPARGILKLNNDFVLTNRFHSHKSNTGLIEKKEKLLQLRKLALSHSKVPGRDILETLGIKENRSHYLNFIRVSRRRQRKRLSNTQKFDVKVDITYKIVNTSKAQRLILNTGYIFRQDSLYPTKNNTRYWRCMGKGCKARAITDALGNLSLSNNEHNHPPKK